MKAMVVTSSLGLGAVPSPSLSCKTGLLNEHLLSRNETLCLLSMRAW
jgi:hypothetical protein